MHDLGDTIRLAAECRDAAGTLANAVTAALTITLPDGTTTSPAVTNPPAQTGRYTVDYVTVQPGRHAVRWQFTTPASAYSDVFDVAEASPPLILSLAKAKAHLEIGADVTAFDEELRDWLASVTRGVEHFAGVCVRRTVIEKHDVGTVQQLALRRTPVLSVTSVAAVRTGGTSYDPAGLDVDGPTGIVERLDGGTMTGPLRVTYVPGRAVVPPNLLTAARIILQHLWRTRYGGSRAAGGLGGGDDFSVTEPLPGFGYAIPNRAMQLLEPDRLPPGIA